MIYLILFIYLIITFWGSLVFGRGKSDTAENYFLAGRSLKTLTLFFTILATNFSAFYFLGFAGEGYRIGYAYYTMIAMGTSFAGISMYALGTRIWRAGREQGFVTPSELILARSGSKPLAALFALVMVIYTLPYLALQIVGGGYILEKLTNGDISYGMAVIVLTIFTIVYVLIGGMQSVARTDVKQGTLAFLLMTLAVIIITSKLGGITHANKELFTIRPELFSPQGEGGFYTPQKWFSYTVFWVFCIPMFPQLFMRFYVARTSAHLKKSIILYAIAPLFVSILPVIIGVLGHLTFPDLKGNEADQILPMMLVEHTGEWIGALVMVGAIAAFMSTLDSQLLALSTILTRDFYLPVTGRSKGFKGEVFIGRVSVVLLSLIGLIIAFNPFDTIFDMGKIAFAGLSILFPSAMMYVLGKPLPPLFAIISIVTGEALLLLFYYGILPQAWLMGFESFIPILVICFLIVAVGGWRKRK